MPSLSDESLPVPCIVLRVMRAIRCFDQSDLARALGIGQSALSKLERNYRNRSVERALLIRAAEAMDRDERFVDWVFELVLEDAGSPPLPRTPLEVVASKFANETGDRFRELAQESVLATGRPVLAATERANAELLWDFYGRYSKGERKQIVERHLYFHRWGFVERLWRESINAAADDFRRALELGELAVLVAERLDEREPFKSRVLGLAWSAVANARRVGSQLLPAEEDLGRAKGLWKAGETGETEILEEARFRHLEVVLRVAQRRFPEAEASIDAAFRAAKPDENVAYLFITKGNILLELQRHEEAAAVYREANARMSPTTSPRERFGTLFNLTVCLIALGQAKEAEAQLPVLRRMAVAIGNGLDSIRVRWLEGQTLAGLGRREEAIQLLGEVQEIFLARTILYDAALVALEKAALQLEEGAIADVKREAPDLAAAFQALGVAREYLISLEMFWSAAVAERATAEQARHLLAQLRQAGVRPVSAV